jgi:hypothetical protein
MAISMHEKHYRPSSAAAATRTMLPIRVAQLFLGNLTRPCSRKCFTVS